MKIFYFSDTYFADKRKYCLLFLLFLPALSFPQYSDRSFRTTIVTLPRPDESDVTIRELESGGEPITSSVRDQIKAREKVAMLGTTSSGVTRVVIADWGSFVDLFVPNVGQGVPVKMMELETSDIVVRRWGGMGHVSRVGNYQLLCTPPERYMLFKVLPTAGVKISSKLLVGDSRVVNYDIGLPNRQRGVMQFHFRAGEDEPHRIDWFGRRGAKNIPYADYRIVWLKGAPVKIDGNRYREEKISSRVSLQRLPALDPPAPIPNVGELLTDSSSVLDARLTDLDPLDVEDAPAVEYRWRGNLPSLIELEQISLNNGLALAPGQSRSMAVPPYVLAVLGLFFAVLAVFGGQLAKLFQRRAVRG